LKRCPKPRVVSADSGTRDTETGLDVWTQKPLYHLKTSGRKEDSAH
jgi:hypothetical protein